MEREGRVGTLLHGRYRIEEELAEGALGRLYRAAGEPDGAPVAILLLPASDRVLEQKVRDLVEAPHAPADADQVGVVAWRSFAITPEGEAYLVGDLPAGEPLARILERVGRLGPRRTRELLLGTLRALVGARDLLVGDGHLALSSACVFVDEERDGPGAVSVLDFGVGELLLSLSVGSTPDDAPSIGGEMPEYAAPEVCRRLATGAARPRLDDRADLFSVGVLGYRMLTGELPHDAVGGMRVRTRGLPGAGRDERLLTRASTPCRTLAERGAHAPRRLGRFIDRCLSFDRVQRHGDAREALRELEALALPNRRLGFALAAGAVLVSVAAWAAWRWSGSDPAAPIGFEARPSSTIYLGAPDDLEVALALDGNTTLSADLPLGLVGERGRTAPEWEAALLADGRHVRLRAPASVTSGRRSLRVTQGGRSSLPVRIVVLGEDAFDAPPPVLEGWDGSAAVDPEGVLLTASVTLAPGLDRNSLVAVEVSATDARLARVGPLELTARADDPTAFELPLEELGLSPGPARLVVSLVDALGIRRDLPELEPTLLVGPLEFLRAELRGGDRLSNGEVQLVSESAPELALELNRPARVSWTIQVDGELDRVGEELDWPAGEELAALPGLVDPALGRDHAGSIRITAREAVPVLRRGAAGRGEASAELDYRVTFSRIELDSTLTLAEEDGSSRSLERDRTHTLRTQPAVLELERKNDLQLRVRVRHEFVTGVGVSDPLHDEIFDFTDAERPSPRLVLPLEREGLHRFTVDVRALDPATGEAMERPREERVWNLVYDASAPGLVLDAGFGTGALLRSLAPLDGLRVTVNDRPPPGVPPGELRLGWRVNRSPGGRLVEGGQTVPSSAAPIPLHPSSPEPQGWLDGHYALSAWVTDAAGNSSPPAQLLWELAARGPACHLEWPVEDPASTPWARADDAWTLRAVAQDPNGLRPWLDGTLEAIPLEGRPTPAPIALRLSPDGRTAGAFVGDVPFTPAWSGHTVRVRVLAQDLHGNVSEELVDTRPLGPIVERVYAVLRGRDAAGERTVGEMRLVRTGVDAGTPYRFQGRDDGTENARFDRDGVGGPFSAGGAGTRAWGLEIPPASLGDYYLDRDEVSRAEYLDFVQSPDGYAQARLWPEGTRPDPNRLDQLAVALEIAVNAGHGERPVTHVAWAEAVAYANWVGKRLPTLVEHEFAVRGGRDYRAWSGAWVEGARLEDSVNFDPAGAGNRGAWSRGAGQDTTPEGLRDLCGNVMEWSASAAPPDLRSDRAWAEEDPDRILRHATAADAGDYYVAGASFLSLGADFSKLSARPRTTRSPEIGFRCALSRADLSTLLRNAHAGPFHYELTDD